MTSPGLLITGCRLVGGTGRPVDVVMRDGRFESVAETAGSTAGSTAAASIDGAGLYLMAGLIDVHVHLILDAEPDIVGYVRGRDPADDPTVAARNADQALRAGFTGLRDMGCAGFAVPRVRDARSANGLGPSINACGHMITAAKGHVLDISCEIDGAADADAAVDAQLAGGADFVKLIISGGLLTPGTHPGHREMQRELIAAVGSAAADRGVHLAVHAYHDELVIEALDAGARTIEHGSWLTPEVLRQMAAAGAILVPTLSAPRAILDHAHEMPDHAVANAEAAWNASQGIVDRAGEAGVRIAVGTDAGTPFNRHGDNARELDLLVELGMSRDEAIEAATTVGAAVIGAERVGRIEPGWRADAVLLGADPRLDLQALRDVRVVVSSGLARHVGA